jgi:hypothetical protein
VIHFTCDGGCGTGSADKKDFVTFGYAKKKIYCHECAPCVVDYMKELDELHSAAAKVFAEGRGALQKKWTALHPAGMLPDQ